jgi:hypothetical protein
LSADTSGPGAGGNVYKLQQRSKALVGWTSDAQFQYNHMEIPSGIQMTAGKLMWLLIRNMHSDPANNVSSLNLYTTRNTIYLPDGTIKVPPNAVNTTDKNANYAIFGFDPRESVASKPTTANTWNFGRLTGRYQGPAGSNDDLRVAHYFWRESGSTRFKSKAYPALAYNTTAGTSAPSVTYTNAPTAAVLKYFFMFPSASGTCSVTAQVRNSSGTVIQTVVGNATASAPSDGAPMIGTFPTNVNIAVGQGITLTGNKDVWVTELDGYTAGFRSRTDDWPFTSNANEGNYPGLGAFGVRGTDDWPWGYANRQRLAEGGTGTPIASNLTVSATTVSFAAVVGSGNPVPQAVRISDTANGSTKGFTATVTGSASTWLRLRVGTTGTVATSVTGTADADLYLVPTNQATAGSYSATVTITPAQSGDTVPSVTASMTVSQPSAVDSFDGMITAVASRYWKLEETSGLFVDTMGGASLLATGSGLTRSVVINEATGGGGTTPVPTGNYRSVLDSLGTQIVAHWPLGEAS